VAPRDDPERATNRTQRRGREWRVGSGEWPGHDPAATNRSQPRRGTPRTAADAGETNPVGHWEGWSKTPAAAEPTTSLAERTHSSFGPHWLGNRHRYGGGRPPRTNPGTW